LSGIVYDRFRFSASAMSWRILVMNPGRIPGGSSRSAVAFNVGGTGSMTSGS